MEPRLRASPEQFSVLIDFIERHGDLSRPESGPQGRIKADRLWQQLTLKLNSLGGGVQKTPDKWKKVWADWKTKTKKKYLSLRRLQASNTGSGPNYRIKLTPLEERVVAVIKFSSAVGQAGIQEQEFHAGNATEVPVEHTQYEIILEDHTVQNIALPASPEIPSTESLPQPEDPPHIIIATPASNTHTPLPSQSPPSPRSPPAGSNRRQPSASPRSASSTTRRASFRARRNRTFERMTEQIINIEQRRLVHEELRDKRLHEREMERLRIEAERIDVTREHNSLLHQLSILGQQLINVITQQQPRRSPSADSI